jgi:hypothetical protein
MGTTVAAEKRRSGGRMRRRGSRTPARSLRATGVHGIEKTAQDGYLPSCEAPRWLTATSRRRWQGNRKRRRLGFAAALGLCVWGTGWGFQGRRAAYKGLGRTLGVQATHGEACRGRTSVKAESWSGTTRWRG